MTPIALGLVGIGVLFVLLAIRMPVGICLAVVSFLGIWSVRGLNAAFGTLKSIPYDFAAHWTLSAIPMFLLMGAIVSQSGMTSSLFAAMRVWLGWLPGGLAVATNFAGAGFAAASGSSLATTATLGRIAVPEMLRFNYNPGLATGVATAVGTLGAVIPPSIVIVLFAIFAEVPVGQVLIAGVIPGLLTAFAYATLIVVRCTLNPELAPRINEQNRTFRQKLALILPIWPLPLLVIGVIGGIYSGITTATEAGAAGAVIALILSVLQRKMGWQDFKASLIETARSTASLMLVAIGAALLTRFLAFTGIPGVLSSLIDSLGAGPIAIILAVSVVYIVLGCFLDPLGVLLLTLPILLPIFEAADMNLIWVGIILVKYIEIGMLTPPVGLNVFIMKGIMGDRVSLVSIFKGVSWFLLAEVVVMTLLITFPGIVLFLPGLMEN
ncbi:TRAP transporter large permease [Oceanicola sp. 502str15]|uniref:TRAP transporter large permease n=1 Tax=Oceanicola sp. 502str15 TaxID=2696061 RepID=UPI002094A98B|nr:TRAP transporter large permease subunit [Oceanicola sp. 502str15]MCO6385295.1 TRAP transporter large permease subunit [Oceanicola sp. 502str15]